jgi:endo-1,4-beta-xylanase
LGLQKNGRGMETFPAVLSEFEPVFVKPITLLMPSPFRIPDKKKFLIPALVLFLFLAAEAQIAKDNCKFLGNVVASSLPSDFDKYWNQVTPENAGKWGSVESERDVMNWDQLDLAYEHAKSKGYPFKQHTLVWGQQQPEWLSALSQEEQKAEVEEWIKAFCERYPETDFIDVVNEPLHAVPGYANALGGSGVTGWDWVIWSFEKAREYLPNAKLVLNDYNILNNNTATAQYLGIIDLLQERNLIDVIGEQGHFLETTPLGTIKTNLDKFHDTGLPVHISEYDVNISSDADQKDVFEEQFAALWSHPAVKGITLWGYRQGQIWRTDAYLVRSNNTERPALTWLKTYVASTTVEDFCSVTANEPNSEIGFNAFPNPSSGSVTVELRVAAKEISIIDSTGRMVKTSGPTASGSTIDLQLQPGLYVVKIRNAHETQFAKILVL